jgi:predicted nucleotidyltransferase
MIGKNELLAWLAALDKKLDREITLIAVGGTALTLLGLKSSTRDVDFCLKVEDRPMFGKIVGKTFKVDLFVDGYIFSEQLPPDYLEKAKEIRSFSRITLKALHPVDIIITKAARFNARDEEDIKAVAKYVNKKELLARFEEVVGTFAGNEREYRHHMGIVMKRFFKDEK